MNEHLLRHLAGGEPATQPGGHGFGGKGGQRRQQVVARHRRIGREESGGEAVAELFVTGGLGRSAPQKGMGQQVLKQDGIDRPARGVRAGRAGLLPELTSGVMEGISR